MVWEVSPETGSDAVLEIKIHPKNTSLESVSMKGLTISLLSSGDGTEIIHHKLEQGSQWAIAAEDGWTALEYVYILSGELLWKSSQGDVIIRTGDSITAHMITELAILDAVVTTEFLYVTSRPVFLNYSTTNQELMELSVTIEEKDGYTSDHCERIRKLSLLVGEELMLSPYDLFILNMAAFFHDIGKARVPESILNKPAKLTDEEYEIMKLHTTHGKELLHEKGLPDFKLAGDIVEQHHERYDGKGYPYGLKGNEISVLAAIIAVVDSFDAMTVDRIYHKGIPADQALQEIKNCSGTIYHPEIVSAFVQVSHKFAMQEGR
jgi:putative nucleotidyltransferase with HDIG domain